MKQTALAPPKIRNLFWYPFWKLVTKQPSNKANIFCGVGGCNWMHLVSYSGFCNLFIVFAASFF